MAPGSDSFAGATDLALTPPFSSNLTDMNGMTVEPGEVPDLDPILTTDSLRSVWWKFTVPDEPNVVVTLAANRPDTLPSGSFIAYQGSSLGSLTIIRAQSWSDGSFDFFVPHTPGAVYYFRYADDGVDGDNNQVNAIWGFTQPTVQATVCPLHIPHKDWALGRPNGDLEMNNYTAIERWAKDFAFCLS